jgi:hypothetical protein
MDLSAPAVKKLERWPMQISNDAKVNVVPGGKSGTLMENVRGERLIRQPVLMVCIVLVSFSAIFFIRHGINFYATVDFASRDLGGSDTPDFFVFYSSARYLWEGGTISGLYDFSTLKAFQISLGATEKGLHPFNYPPTYLFLIWPLGALPYPLALIAWQAFNIGVFAAALRVAGLRPVEILAAVVAPATVLNFSAGQNGCITSALLISGLVLLVRRQKEAGCLFGLLTIKPHLGLLVPIVCLAQRRWLAIIAAICVISTMIGISILQFGPASWGAYLDFLVKFQAKIQTQVSGDFLKYSATVLMAEQFLGLPKMLAYGIQIAISVFVGVIVYRAYRQPMDETLRLVLVLVGVSLVTPFGFLYDLPFLGVAVVLMARIGLRDGFLPLEAVSLSAIWHMPYLSAIAMEQGIPLAPWAHLIFFCYVVARILQSKQQPKTVMSVS